MERYLTKNKTKLSSQSSGDEESSSSSSKKPKLDLDHNTPDQSLSSPPSRGSLACSYNPKDICSFGEKCYRRNVHHFREYRHPHLEALITEIVEKFGCLDSSSKLPETYKTTLDKSLVLDQLNILKAAGFKPSSKQIKQANDSDSDNETFSKKYTNTNTRKKSHSPNLNTVQVEKEKDTKESQPHKSSNTSLNSLSQSQSKSRSKSGLLTPMEKWRLSQPFNLFLTAIGDEDTNFSMSFRHLFHESFGAVKAVVHINFMMQMQWLMDEIIAASMWEKPTMFIYGTENPGVVAAADEFPWVQAYRMKAPHAFGHHHTKMSLIEYEDLSIRFVIYTANLIEADWSNKTQGMWISPKCPRLDCRTDSDSGAVLGESPTGFRSDILSYLTTYQLKLLEPWLNKINNADCSEIKVVFIGSAPNTASSHFGSNGFKWGLKKVETVLRKYETTSTTAHWPLIAQCSSIGSLGPDSSWLDSEWSQLLQGKKKSKPPIKLVYPTVSDVKNSVDGVEGADCLPYASLTHSKQCWLESHMCRWSSFLYNRTFYMPHVKSYCRLSPDNKSMAWFILSSANLSKAAWGKLNKKKDQLVVMSWEVGVLFLPKLLTDTDVFTGHEKQLDNDSTVIQYPFPVPFDLPVTPFSSAQKPWLCDYLGHPRRR